MLTRSTFSTEYRVTSPTDPLTAAGAGALGALIFVTMMTVIQPPPTLLMLAWASAAMLIVWALHSLNEHRTAKTYAHTTWRLTDDWLEMQSPVEHIRISRPNITTITPAPDGIIVRGRNGIIAVPDAIDGYEDMRAQLLDWLATVPQ